MKIMRRFVCLAAGALFIFGPTLAAASPGSLDGTFGRNGFMLYAHETYSANDVKVQSNGRILVSGDVAGTGNAIGGFSVLRFLSDGRIDTHFATGGLAVAPFNSGLNIAESMAIQTDGKVVAVGNTVEDGPKTSAMAIARFSQGGSLDPTFGTNGTDQLILTGSTNSSAFVALLLPSTKILIGGSATFPSGQSGVVVRLNPNGMVDTTFGLAGVALTGTAFPVTGIGTQRDGKIVALSGKSAVRFLKDGTLDSQRARGTLVSQAHFGPTMLTPSEKIIESLGVRDSQSGNDVDTQTFRLFPDGTNDGSFVSPIFDFLSSMDDIYQNEPYGIALQDDGSVLIAGSGQDTNAVFEGALARLVPTGALDSSFGQAGIVASKLDGNDQFTALALQADGKIVAAGLSFATSGDLVVARYTSR